jgi:hypothetical protein
MTAYRLSVGKSKRERPLGRPGRRWEGDIKKNSIKAKRKTNEVKDKMYTYIEWVGGWSACVCV